MKPFDHYRLVLLALVLFCVLPLSAAQAHKLNIFAWPSQDNIQGEAVFSGGRKAKNIKVTVQNAETHLVLLETISDQEGGFQFALPELAREEQVDLLIAAYAGEGHRGEWLVPAKEYLHAGTSPTLSQQNRTNAPLDEQLIRQIAAEEMDKKLAPIRQTLAESRKRKPELRDILGGIGCIIGLAALVSWVLKKKPKK